MRNGYNRGGDPVIGKCYACGGPLRRTNAISIADPAVGVRRKLHRGDCEDRFLVQRGPQIEGKHA